MTNSGDARNKLAIINRLLYMYNICAAKELPCLWTYFLSAIERVNKIWDLHYKFFGWNVTLWQPKMNKICSNISFIQACFIETTILKLSENIS